MFRKLFLLIISFSIITAILGHSSFVEGKGFKDLTPKDIAKIQRALKKAGYSPGPVDGIVGKKTINALKEFQGKKGLRSTGTPTQKTLKLLLKSAKENKAFKVTSKKNNFQPRLVIIVFLLLVLLACVFTYLFSVSFLSAQKDDKSSVKASDTQKKNEILSKAYLGLGRVFSLKRESSYAIKAFLRAIELSSKKKEYLYYLAKEYRVVNSLNDAKENLKKALKLDDKYVEAHSLLSEVCLLNKEYKEAEDHCRLWINLKGYDIQNLFILIPALYYQENFRKVVEVTKELEKFQPLEIELEEAKETSFCIARSYSQLGNYDKAIGWYTDLIEVARNSRNLYYFGCALANKGDYEQALTQFGMVISQGNGYRNKAYLQRGHIFLEMAKVKGAKENYHNAYDIDPKNPDILSALGCYYYNSGDVEKASSWFSRTLEVDSSHSFSHFSMGLIKEKQGEITEAVKEYELAIKNGNNYSPVHLRLGILYYRQSNYHKALEHLQQASLSGEESDSILFYLGLTAQFCGEYEKTLEVWEKLSNRYPDDTKLELNIYRAYYLLGCQYTKERKYQKAISEWERYFKKYDADEKTKKDLAELYFRAGVTEFMNGKSININKAESLFEKAIELDGDNKIYLYYYGLCNLGMGNHTECIAQLDRLLEIQPDDPRIKYHIGLSLLRNGERGKAINIFNELANREGKNAYVSHAGWVIANEHIKERHYDKAISILETTI